MTDQRGAYGFAIKGIAADDWLVEAPPNWPTITITAEVGSVDDLPEVAVDTVRVPLMRGGALEVRASEKKIRFVTSEKLSDAALIHPYLAPAAAILAADQGWNTLHAGAFVNGSEAWVVTAERGGGKSTTLARLDRAGYPVLSDDLVVIDEGNILAGPRSLDLREPLDFTDAEDLGQIGERHRWRVRLGSVPSVVPVVGVLVVEWAEQASIARLDATERAKTLSNAWSYRPTPQGLLQALALPVFLIKRPRGALKDTLGLVESVVGEAIE